MSAASASAKPRSIRTTTTSTSSGSARSGDAGEALAQVLKLQEAISHIHQHNASQLSYEELYRLGYNLVMQRHGDLLFQHTSGTLRAHLQHERDGLIQLTKRQDESLLPALAELWKHHCRETGLVADIVMYLDKTWLPQQPTNSSTALPSSVLRLGHALFCEVVLNDALVHERARAAVLGLIRRHREGELVDLGAVRSVFSMLHELGCFEAYVELSVLQATEDYYGRQSLDMLANATCYEYCQFAENKLKEESRLAQALGTALDADKLRRLVLKELVVRHSQLLVDMPHTGFLSMVREDRRDELRLLFRLLEDALGQDAFGHCAKLYGAYVSASLDEILGNQQHEFTLTVGEAVERLMHEKQRCDAVLKHSFGQHKLFVKTVKESFAQSMNQTVRCASLLALYCNELLSAGGGSNKEQQEEEGGGGGGDVLDRQLDRVMDLFRHLADKDVFEERYKECFSKRLLQQRSVGKDQERSMILKMKTECGHQFTSKLEGMFRDMDQAVRTTAAAAPAGPAGGIAFTAQVLTSGHWPSSVQQHVQCQMPAGMLAVQQEFERQYLAQYSGRKMQWSYLLGQCEVRATGLSGGAQHELVVSPAQAALLVLVSGGGKRRTFGELQRETQLPRDELKRQLISLCVNKFQVLSKLQGSLREFADEDEYQANALFKSKLRRIRIPLVSMPSTGGAAPASADDNLSAVSAIVSEARNHQMDACVVRVMKARKRLEHSLLVNEVLAQLQFKPQVQDVKKRIEALIDRDYLERDQDDQRVYNYMA